MTSARENRLHGIALMIISMVAFALADTLVKVASDSVSSAQVLFCLLGGGLIAFSTMAIIKRRSFWNRQAFAPVLLLRYASEIIGMVGMVKALKYVPLSIVGAITQATPLLAILGSVLFLGERVGWRRWTSVLVGFLGVLLIIQPGTDGFERPVLWAVLALVALSVRDLTTRLTPPGMASSILASYTMMAALPFAIGWVLYNGESLFPGQADWPVLIAMSSLGALGYILLISSLRMAEVSVVMPFRYSRIVFLLILGVVFFNERPGALMLFGAVLIIASGIYAILANNR